MTLSAEPVTVLSIPAGHPYISAVAAGMAGAVAVLPDPSEPWWPHAALEPGWLTEHAGCFDAVHLHFGFDHLSPAGMSAWLDEVDRVGAPLVHTIHDLRNPHHPSSERHDAHLELLTCRAAHLFTLTEAAADRIAGRFGRRPEVVAHPGVIWSDRAELPAADDGLVGIHLGPLRCSIAGAAALVAAAAAGARRVGGRVVVDIEPGAGSHRPDGAAERAALERVAAEGVAQLDVRPPRSDDGLAGHLGRLHVAVLPYRFGTHSGWLEACRDAGTTIVAPTCGYYADQWPEVVSYRHDERRGLDAESLADAVATAVSRPAPAPSDLAWRLRQRHDIALAHVATYCRLLERR